MKKEEINLKNPIFVYYINVGGLSRKRAQEEIFKIQKEFDYENITTWFVARSEGETEIKLIWNPRIDSSNDDIKGVVKEISDILSAINSGKDPVIGLKQFLRSWKLNRLL